MMPKSIMKLQLILIMNMLQYQKNTTQINLEVKVPKVLCVSVAFNNTFVMVRMDKPCQQESIVHFDANGKILYEHTYDQIIDTFGQMNDKEVIVLNVSKSMIEIINLEHQTVRSVNHKYLFQDPVNMAIYNFSDSRMFCIQEKGCFNDHRLRLSYYSYDNLEENSQPVAVYMSKDNEWTYDHVIFKANNHSKILWVTCCKHEQIINFNYFDLKEDPKGKLQTVRAVNNLGVNYGNVAIVLGVGSIWECRQNQYMIQASSNKSQLKAYTKPGVCNNNYILDATLGNDKGTLRQTKFTFEVDAGANGISYNDQLIYCFGIGNISVFHAFAHKNGQAVQTPIYYVNNDTQEIIAQETWFCACNSLRYYFPGWDKNCFIQAQHDNGDVLKIKVSQKRFLA